MRARTTYLVVSNLIRINIKKISPLCLICGFFLKNIDYRIQESLFERKTSGSNQVMKDKFEPLKRQMNIWLKMILLINPNWNSVKKGNSKEIVYLSIRVMNDSFFKFSNRINSNLFSPVRKFWQLYDHVQRSSLIIVENWLKNQLNEEIVIWMKYHFKYFQILLSLKWLVQSSVG